MDKDKLGTILLSLGTIILFCTIIYFSFIVHLVFGIAMIGVVLLIAGATLMD